MTDERMTDIEVALAYDRRLIDQLNEALIDASKTIDVLEARVKRLEELVQSVTHHFSVLPPNEKPPHY